METRRDLFTTYLLTEQVPMGLLHYYCTVV